MSAPVFRRCMAWRPSASSCNGVSRDLTGRLEVERLAADHAGRTGGVRDRARRTHFPRDHGRVVGRRLAREERERLGLQPVAGQNGDAVAVDDMQRRPSAPQRVVVHRRQVVVNQRVGVNQLDGARRREGIRDGSSASARCRANGIRRGERQQRAQPLAAGKQAVAHRLAEQGRAVGRPGQMAFERFIDQRAGAFEKAGGSRNHRSGSSSAQRRRRRLQLAAVGQNLDAPLGLLEPRVAEPRQLDAALVERQRLLERQVAFFELLDDRLELGDRGFEVLDGRVMPVSIRTLRSASSPLRERHPHAIARLRGRRVADHRVRSAFQQTA